ncbi:hypothetical protein HRR83_000424 [Exophiala dermatitidis]|nr:hypothetical protein HRR83_000424 [Exophiala dermatitidis]
MGRSSPQGLTASDFHHQDFVNPVDVFGGRARLARGLHGYRTPGRSQGSSRSSSQYPFPNEPQHHKFPCCGEEEEEPSYRSSNALNCCIKSDGVTGDEVDFLQQSYNCGSGCCDDPPPLHNSPSPMDCEDCVEDCDDCAEEHQQLNHHQRVQGYDDDCEEFKDEQLFGMGLGQPCKDNCDECDFSCFDCIDWNEFERDKSLGLSFSVPLLGDNGFPTTGSNALVEETPAAVESSQPDENDHLVFQTPPELSGMSPDGGVVHPLDMPMHHQCFDNTIPYWNHIGPAQLCTGIPGLQQTQQYPLPPFVLEYGCHPATAHQQLPSPTFPTATSPNNTLFSPAPTPNHTSPPASNSVSAAPAKTNNNNSGGPLADTKDLVAAVSAPSTSRACQWLMPCGTVCGASFASATDLKKHLKAVHLMKGVIKCRWQGCDSAEFTSEAALTGHISKKHLAPMLASGNNGTNNHHHHHTSKSAAASNGISGDSDNQHHHHHHDQGGPFKCTYPGCPKSFMYKQVRDEHVASCHNGNKMYCHICGQYLNGEGSNFKRHMATHRPKHQHMLCKFHGLGCKRRFPRLDNLRRHEACCKFGKKAGLVNAKVPVSASTTTAAAANSDEQRKHVHHHHHHVHAHPQTPAATATASATATAAGSAANTPSA